MKRSILKRIIRSVINEVLSEARDYDLKSFSGLPNRSPYGFVIWPDLTISVIGTLQGHGAYIWKRLDKNRHLIGPDWDGHEWEYKGVDVDDILDKKGLLELVVEDDFLWVRGKGNPKTRRLAKDIAAMYQLIPTFEPS